MNLPWNLQDNECCSPERFSTTHQDNAACKSLDWHPSVISNLPDGRKRVSPRFVDARENYLRKAAKKQQQQNKQTNKKNPHAKKQNKINSCTCKLSSPNQIAPSQSRDTPPVDALPFLELLFVLSLAETGCVAIYWEPHYYVAATAHRAINGDHRAPVVLNGGEEWGGINKLCHETAVSGGVDGPCINSG